MECGGEELHCLHIVIESVSLSGLSQETSVVMWLLRQDHNNFKQCCLMTWDWLCYLLFSFD